jgi:branched-chain amino acid transport system substrate-binding protein
MSDSTAGRPAVEVCVSLDANQLQPNHPVELVSLARAFLRTDHESARFVWFSDGDWISASLERRVTRPGAAHALLAYSDLTLPSGVSTREVDILTLVALGLTNGEIATRLGTSSRTVGTQIERLLAKLNQAGRGGLAALAVDWGILRLPIPGGSTRLRGLRIIDIDQAMTVAPAADTPRRADLLFLHKRHFLLGTVAGSIGGSTSHAQEIIRGSSLAVDQINAQGGVAGRRIQHEIVRADIYDPSSVMAAFTRLIALGVDAITTSFASATHPEVFDTVAAYGCPYLHSDTYEHSANLVRNNPHRYSSVFQTCPSETSYAEGFIDFLVKLSASGRWVPRTRRIVNIMIEPDDHEHYLRALIDCAERAGWEVSDTITSSPETVEWSYTLRRIQARRPDVVAVTHWNPNAIVALQSAIATLRLPCLVFYMYTPSTMDFASSLGDRAEGVVWSTVTGRYEDEIGRRFHREFSSMFGTEPGWSASSAAYDQVRLLAAAWAAVGTAEFQNVCNFLRSTPQRGVNGIYYFGEPGQSAIGYPFGTADPSLGQAQLVYQIQNGRPLVLSPPPHGDLTAFRLPLWIDPGPD